jgi:hypothetical protein
MSKTTLFEIGKPGSALRWTDDTPQHGTLFVTMAMAQRCMDRHRNEITEAGASIIPCELDEDLAQMGNLYHEGK